MEQPLPLAQQVVSDAVEIQLINNQVDAALKELDAAKLEAQAEADKRGIPLADLLRNPLVKQKLDPKIAAFSDLVQRRSDLLGRKSDRLLIEPAVDLKLAQRNINIEAPKGTPFLERLENQRKLVDTDLKTIQTIQEYIDLTGDPDGKLNEALEAAQKKLEKDIGAQGYGEGIIKELESSEGIPVEDIPFEDIPFTYPLEKRGGEMVPFYRQPGGGADRREVRDILPTTPIGERYRSPLNLPPELPDEPPTADGRDASFKVKAGEKAGKLVDAGQLDTYLQKPVGQSVEQLYKANKAKGNQTDKELLSYIAKEFPRIEDQEIAATTLMGLSYRDAIAGKLG
jgi:hypothetical protein